MDDTNADEYPFYIDPAAYPFYKDLLGHAVHKVAEAAMDKQNLHKQLMDTRKSIDITNKKIRVALNGIEDLILKLGGQGIMLKLGGNRFDGEVRDRIKYAEATLALKEPDRESGF